ncbi:ferredoxin [Micromonospora fluostatini]|uniref:Ferredoxin n=2 Tax=Micromonospora TaxID=1873 RepID=A0A136PTC9_9ACTN|nr:ferredoxin [Micromonospora rosaria]KXK61749.1 cytochrome [Micromonospora rosaria]TDB90303.1 ferredoxin [Micromonospora fluostatini]
MGENGWRVRVDGSLCIGAGICASTAPSHFALDDGLSQPLAERIQPDEAVRDAADSCPMEAITVFDVVTGVQVAPEP